MNEFRFYLRNCGLALSVPNFVEKVIHKLSPQWIAEGRSTIARPMRFSGLQGRALTSRLRTYELVRVWRRVKAFPFGRSRKPTFVFLAPEAGLQSFYAGHVLLARVIKDAGHPVPAFVLQRTTTHLQREIRDANAANSARPCGQCCL